MNHLLYLGTKWYIISYIVVAHLGAKVGLELGHLDVPTTSIEVKVKFVYEVEPTFNPTCYKEIVKIVRLYICNNGDKICVGCTRGECNWAYYNIDKFLTWEPRGRLFHNSLKGTSVRSMVYVIVHTRPQTSFEVKVQFVKKKLDVTMRSHALYNNGDRIYVDMSPNWVLKEKKERKTSVSGGDRREWSVCLIHPQSNAQRYGSTDLLLPFESRHYSHQSLVTRARALVHY